MRMEGLTTTFLDINSIDSTRKKQSSKRPNSSVLHLLYNVIEKSHIPTPVCSPK